MRTDLERFCDAANVKASVIMSGEAPESWPIGTNAWRVTLTYKRRRLTVPFYTGPAIDREPTAADVLSCILSDARAGEMTFPEFCSEFGYDSDSRRAEDTWRKCVAMGRKVARFLGPDREAFESREH